MYEIASLLHARVRRSVQSPFRLFTEQIIEDGYRAKTVFVQPIVVLFRVHSRFVIFFSKLHFATMARTNDSYPVF